MTFKKFKSDAAAAAQKAAGGGIPGVLSVANGDSDGEVVVKYHHESLPRDVRIQALAQDVSEYPDGNMFMLWTDDPDPPAPVVAAIKTAQDYLLGMSVYEMITELVGRLEKEIAHALGGGGHESASEADDDDPDDYDAAYDADYPSDGEEFGLPSSAPRHPCSSALALTPDQKLLLTRIRRDLRQVKQAGYNVGFLDVFGRTGFSGLVSISIRVNKLALSDEAMEAWNVKPDEYVVLLIRFEKAYQPLERVLGQAAAHAEVKFRSGKCSKYKPTLIQALAAFTDSESQPATAATLDLGPDDQDHTGASFEKLFISNSLDQFLDTSFVSLLKLRETHGCDWEAANEYLLQSIGVCVNGSLPEAPPPTNFAADSGAAATTAHLAAERHHVLVPDHLLEKGPASERSLPLIAMQFAMRYFVKCTEYCLRCHRRLEKGFEALRPYVCSDPLCLFQYMAMGFGPSIEHEILNEPYVVDLLVSLCYAAIQPFLPGVGTLPIRTLPVGLRLRVPDLSNGTANPLKARMLVNDTRLEFEDQGAEGFGERLAPGKWLALRRPGYATTRHARILEVSHAAKSATIEVLANSAVHWGGLQSGPANTLAPVPAQPPAEDCIVDVFAYDADFDSLDDNSKGFAMRHLLDTLPPILDIEEWLNSHPRSSLRSMDRISPAAASLLQWIVSSNRSCIFQVDRSRAVTRRWAGRGSQNGDAGVAGRGRNREPERILGMDGWIQFRFAQGSPDKELRFNRALQEVAARKPIQSHPTIFAWHGSRLFNWHSIVRTGLDYKDIRTGRAFGHGVYFSPLYNTSIAYAGGGESWPNSDLAISSCLSLNEIINAPDEFVSRSPHYVVSQLDWHQCRYLFVNTVGGRAQLIANDQSSGGHQANRQTATAFYPQAPGLEVFGQSGMALQIPLSAIPLRTMGPGTQQSPAKRTALRFLEDSDEDNEDVSMLFTDDEFDAVPGPPNKKSTSRASSLDTRVARDIGNAAGPPTPASINIDRSLTDFDPGALDLASLPRLSPPSFATDAATKNLSRELVRLQHIQAKTSLHELGWYMDFDQVGNLFQWIVQLHSFDAALPLAHDMKRAGVRSIVLELRFPADYPFSPPFVRVVRPRFLPFAEGGGGHVTAGGAMCMELLTSSGWSPANSMESVLLQVRMALCSVDPRPARLDRNPGRGDYGVAEAVDAFVRAANTHGWVVPDKLHATAQGI